MISGAVANRVQDNVWKVCGHYPCPPNFQNDGQSAQQQIVAATRWLLATDHVILNHDQVTWTTPEQGTPNYHLSSNYRTTPTGRVR
ncbi:hypothetical protein TNCV_2598361 [Trichonephila clavipes]|nr:hypothetical protein TNCV_2598361 [Trichonephila clavipes]